MKSAMPFRGIALPEVRRIARGAVAETGPHDTATVLALVTELWDGARHREDRYAALEILGLPRHRKACDAGVLVLVGRLIVEGAWWDITDELAGLVGHLLPLPGARATVVSWVDDPDLWLRRCAIICQLRRKDDTDLDLLTFAIERNAADKDFFIRKAIGWALRDYGYHDPGWVLAFVDSHELAPLSRREATRRLSAPPSS